MKILTLDLATVTGYAIHHPGKVIQVGSRDFTQRKGRKTLPDEHKPTTQLLYWLKGLGLNSYELVVWERPGFFKTFASRNSSVGLRAITDTLCDIYGVKTFEVSPSSIKKFATGKGNAKKHDMVAAARRMSGGLLEGHDHNAADAYVLLRYVLSEKEGAK